MSVSVSVVVVSRDRPDALYLCVLGLSQLQYSDFEIVVVADAKGLAAIEIFREQVKKFNSTKRIFPQLETWALVSLLVRLSRL